MVVEGYTLHSPTVSTRLLLDSHYTHWTPTRLQVGLFLRNTIHRDFTRTPHGIYWNFPDPHLVCYTQGLYKDFTETP